jgi:hypothetical protein
MSRSRSDEYIEDYVYTNDTDFFGKTVSLRRDGVLTEDIAAIIEITDNEVVDQETGVLTTVRSRDYIIYKDAYAINGAAVTPRKGDIILETVGAAERLFEVLPFSMSGSSKLLPQHEEEDADGIRWRIRTKEIYS